MSKAAQLKKKASEYEHKKQYDRALAAYVQAIEAATGVPEELDIPLYNRVGDLHLRLGDLEQAVAYYEMAVDLYAEGGFFNNAIALCNKILRHTPSRSSIYYKLGKISARKGFNSDAKQNFLEYADRMQKAGETDEAFRALKEFADLCPGQDDVRLMLAEQLGRVGRRDEALEQLQIVHDTMIAEDRQTEATATLERMRALDPSVEPRQGRAVQREKQDRLVFIDVNDELPVPAVREEIENGETGAGVEAEPAVETRPKTVEEFENVELPPPADVHVEKTLDESPIAGIAPLEERPLVIEFSFTRVAPPDPSELGQSVLEEPPRVFDPTLTNVPPSIVDDPTLLTSGAASGEELDGGYAVAPMEGLETTVVVPPRAVDPPLMDTATPSQPASVSDDEFVDLQAWLRETEPPKNPRMTADETQQEPGMVQTDFTEMLEAFKRGVAENVDVSDVDSQYDLGVAYMEMGLFDEAIAQFQIAIRGNAAPQRRVRAYESLGQCFIEQGQYDVAVTSLIGALREFGSGDDTLIGMLYLLGYASEALGRLGEAVEYYQRVFAIDIHFRDVGERLQRARQAAQ